MGTRFEFFEAKRVRPTLWDALQTEEEADEVLDPGTYSLALFGDEAAVFVGTLDELRGLAERMAHTVRQLADAQEPGLPELPTPPTVDDDRADQVLCPHVEADGTVCGAEVNMWDKEPVRRDLRYVAGAWVAGPSSLAEAGGGDEEVQCYSLHTWAVPEIDEWQ